MKIVIKLIIVSTILIGFSQCGSSQDLGHKLEKRAPFKIEKATYQSWVSGVEGGGAGTTIIISLIEKNFTVESIYYKEQVLKPELRENQFIGRYKSTTNNQKEYVLHLDPKKEYGNTVPVKNTTSNQFHLPEDEAVISYHQHGELKYYKLKLVKLPSPKYQ